MNGLLPWGMTLGGVYRIAWLYGRDMTGRADMASGALAGQILALVARAADLCALRVEPPAPHVGATAGVLTQQAPVSGIAPLSTHELYGSPKRLPLIIRRDLKDPVTVAVEKDVGRHTRIIAGRARSPDVTLAMGSGKCPGEGPIRDCPSVIARVEEAVSSTDGMDRRHKAPEEVDVILSYGERPLVPPSLAWCFTLEDPVADELRGWDSDLLVDELLQGAAIPQDGALPAPYEVQVSKTTLSWGASGTGASILIYVSEQMLSGLVGAATVEIARRAIRRALRHGRSTAVEPVGRETAIAWAEERVVRVYSGVNRADLVPISEEEGGTEGLIWRITLIDREATRYVVEHQLVEGAMASMVSRHASDAVITRERAWTHDD